MKPKTYVMEGKTIKRKNGTSYYRPKQEETVWYADDGKPIAKVIIIEGIAADKVEVYINSNRMTNDKKLDYIDRALPKYKDDIRRILQDFWDAGGLVELSEYFDL